MAERAFTKLMSAEKNWFIDRPFFRNSLKYAYCSWMNASRSGSSNVLKTVGSTWCPFMSRAPSHWPAKLSVNWLPFAVSASMRSTWAPRIASVEIWPDCARPKSVSSGIVLQPRDDRRGGGAEGGGAGGGGG